MTPTMTARRGLVGAVALLAVLAMSVGLVAGAALGAAGPAPDPRLRHRPARLDGAHDGGDRRSGARRPRRRPSTPHGSNRTATASGIPAVAVRAYATAAVRLGAEQPGCRLGWTTLAGIGEVESGHGTVGGRTLLADGRSSQPIVGPALDGRGPVAAIRAGPGATALHGDPDWDHAVGPLQFLPTTWRQWGADEDGDGTADPQDLDDAAYAAGRYLCADGHDLSDGAGWQAAVFSYNHASSYVAAVYAAASRTPHADQSRKVR